MTKKLTPEEKEANKFARQAAKVAAAGQPPKKAKAAKPAKAEKKATKKKEKVVNIKVKKARSIGHNSGATGAVNEALQEIFLDYRKLDEDAKVIAKAKRDLRAKAKEEHNVAAANFNHEIRLQKLEDDQRVMFEAGARDLKDMLGIQLSLNLQEDEEADNGDDTGGGTPDPLQAAARASALH